MLGREWRRCSGFRCPRCSGSSPKPLPQPMTAGGARADGAGIASRKEAKTLLESGLGAIKLRLGYPSLFDDLAALRAGSQEHFRRRLLRLWWTTIQALTSTEAILRGRELEKEGDLLA